MLTLLDLPYELLNKITQPLDYLDKLALLFTSKHCEEHLLATKYAVPDMFFNIPGHPLNGKRKTYEQYKLINGPEITHFFTEQDTPLKSAMVLSRILYIIKSGRTASLHISDRLVETYRSNLVAMGLGYALVEREEGKYRGALIAFTRGYGSVVAVAMYNRFLV